MRHMILAMALVAAPLALEAQRDTVGRGLPRDVRREAERLWNADAALRASGATEIPEGRVIDGDVAVETGPLTIAGHVRGRVLALNSDVILRPSARIDGNILVVGGQVEGRDAGYVGGEIRIYRQRLAYERDGDRIVASGVERDRRETARGERTRDDDDEPWWRDADRRRRRYGSFSRFQIASAGAYNRTEGLPVHLGPQIQRVTPWGSVRLDAYGIARTGSSFTSTDTDLGHNVRTEIRLGRVEGVSFGGQAYDMVQGVEEWQLSDLEVGLASFLFRRDYRDYYERHGGRAFASLWLARDVSLTGSFAHERWGPRDIANPFTLFERGRGWRSNPMMDAGVFHLVNGTLRMDTRNDADHPWAGWYIVADWERGAGTYTALGPTSVARTTTTGTRGEYTRGFVDVRRYNRVSPDAQLNFRVMAGGWLAGDPLPLQRRLSAEGAAVLPGYDFRGPHSGWSSGTCGGPTAPPGMPAECDRVAVAQVEYRGDLHFGIGDWDHSRMPSNHARVRRGGDATWVMFADAGRGWYVNSDPANASSFSYGKDRLPPLSSFRTDVGMGLDFGDFGVYVAKALSEPGHPANVFVRLSHRF